MSDSATGSKLHWVSTAPPENGGGSAPCAITPSCSHDDPRSAPPGDRPSGRSGVESRLVPPRAAASIFEPKEPPATLVRVVRRKKVALLAAAAALLLSGCAGQTITKTGRETANLYNIVLVMATIVFAATEGAIIWQVVKYRRRRGRTTGLPPQIHGNRQIEILWTALPSVVIAALFVMSMKVLYDVNAEPKAALNVQVVAYQWQWTFNYLDSHGKPVVVESAKG